MILFINFAPIEYYGGAERKIFELYEEVSKKEISVVLTASNSLASLYGSVVLKQRFDARIDSALLQIVNRKFISIMTLLPFTSSWRDTRKTVQTARIIYCKGELNELFLIVYFGGFTTLRKVIAAIRSPWIYKNPSSFFDYLHNVVYRSLVVKSLFSKVNIIHVLNKNDKNFFYDIWGLKNIIHIPNYIDISKSFLLSKTKKSQNLYIIFIGELLYRKGVDILLKTIIDSPSHFHFKIVGLGPMKSQIEEITKKYTNCEYKGYLEQKTLFKLLSKQDVLFLPSRAESFGNVIIEAMSKGIPNVISPEITLDLPKYISYIPFASESDEYIDIFGKILSNKNENKINKQEIYDYCYTHFSKKIIMPKMHSLFQIN